MSFWGDDFDGRRPGRLANLWHRWAWNRQRHFLLPSLVTLAMVVFVIFMLLPFFIDHRDERGSDRLDVPAFAQKGSQKEDIVDFNKRIIAVADLVKPAVVSVINHPIELEEGLDGSEEVGFGLGSGIIISISGEKAIVVTNQHVIDGGAEYEVVLTTGERREAQLIGSDMFSDIAVLSIDKKGINAVAKFGNSDELEAGESVIAIGNPLGISYAQTITAGIISSLRTPVPVSFNQDGQIDWEADLIQTDAAINRGNSGGALVNLKGEVIGINSMKVADFGVEGLGFAIPSNEAVEVIQSLLEYGKVKRPFIGVASRNLSQYLGERDTLNLPDDVEDGAIILSAEGPAAEAGLQTGDVIVGFDDTAIDSTLALRKYLYEEKEIGDEVKVTFYRDGKKKTVMLKLAEREEE